MDPLTATNIVMLVHNRLGPHHHEGGRPMLAVEIASHEDQKGDRDAFRQFMDEMGTPPHCDARILHRPEDCQFCARAEVMQMEREMLGVRNTGVEGEQAGRKWPCPAELARSKESLGAWGGNRPITDVEYAATTLRSHRGDLGYPGEDAIEVCPFCGVNPCECEKAP